MPKKTEDQIDPTVLSPTGANLGRLDRDAVRATQRLTDRGFEAYLVGGCVRDLLLDREPKDFDIATSARPQQVKRTFPRNCRIIGRRFKLAHLHFDRNTKILEVSTFRRTPEADGSDDDLLITRDNEFGTAEEDALRRDFTVNALFLDPTEDRILDWCNGLQDLEARVIRTIGDPVVRFREDPVRILRAAKFAGRLGFSVDPETFAAMAETAGDLVRAAPPRVLEEILRLLRGGHALASFQLLRDIGALKSLVPVVAEFLGNADRDERDAFWGLLDALDQRVQDGHVPSNAVLLGVLHVGPVLARAAAEPDRSPSSIAEELLGPLSQALKLPRRDAGCLKRICGVQHRFEAAAGKKRFRVGGFVRGPYFAEAIELFGLRAAAGDVDPEALERWHDLAAEHGFDSEGTDGEEPAPARKSRSRRSRGGDRAEASEDKPTRKRSKKRTAASTTDAAHHPEDTMPEPAEADDAPPGTQPTGEESNDEVAESEATSEAPDASSAKKPAKRKRAKTKKKAAAKASPDGEDDAADVIFGAAPAKPKAAKTTLKPATKKTRKVDDDEAAADEDLDAEADDASTARPRRRRATRSRPQEEVEPGAPEDDGETGYDERGDSDDRAAESLADRAAADDDRDLPADEEDDEDRPRRRRRRRRRRSRSGDDEESSDLDADAGQDADADERHEDGDDEDSELAADAEDDEDRPRRRRRRRRGRGKKARADDREADRADDGDSDSEGSDSGGEDRGRDEGDEPKRAQRTKKNATKKAGRKARSRKGSDGGDGKKKRRDRRRGGGRDVDVVPRSRDRRGKVEVIEPPAMDLSAFDVELDPKRVPTFGTIVEGKGRPKRRAPRVREDGQEDYKPPPPPGTGGDAPPPPTSNKPDDPDTFGDW
ncbi:MAG: CCA tRNA nucleotidyltransferase [bacterium]|nr:CCA tRNA nucleotidyltransferase [bacterium]